MEVAGFIRNSDISEVQRFAPGISFKAATVNMPNGKIKVNRMFFLLAEVESEEFDWFRDLKSCSDGRRSECERIGGGILLKKNSNEQRCREEEWDAGRAALLCKRASAGIGT